MNVNRKLFDAWFTNYTKTVTKNTGSSEKQKSDESCFYVLNDDGEVEQVYGRICLRPRLLGVSREFGHWGLFYVDDGSFYRKSLWFDSSEMAVDFAAAVMHLSRKATLNLYKRFNLTDDAGHFFSVNKPLCDSEDKRDLRACYVEELTRLGVTPRTKRFEMRLKALEGIDIVWSENDDPKTVYARLVGL